jgi:hypothetical protein
LATALVALSTQTALALIEGGAGNSPITDPGWPKGAAAIFNHRGRVAWWVGPPFGGGQWHAECRGDAKDLSAALADFARLDVKNKRIVVHDGAGHSFWLNPNREPQKQDAARIDWTFMVWQPANWERLRHLPPDLNPTQGSNAEQGPPSQIDVYTGGSIRWADVAVPEGIEVDDQRLEAHGFTRDDGIVLEGKATDAATGKQLAAQVRLELIEPQKTGGYKYSVTAKSAADEQGRWVIKHAPAGWHRVVLAAQGYVPRVAGYARFDDQPRWQRYDAALATAATVTGHVSDEEGKPLAGVQVRLGDVVAKVGGRYESPDEYTVTTDAAGRFHFDQVPQGAASVWLHKPGYCRPGLGHKIETPAKDLVLGMMRSATVRVTVDFTGVQRPAGYLVQIEPEGGSAVGKWSGSANLNANNEIVFTDVPPAAYVVFGQPNPSNGADQTKRVVVNLKGGQAAQVKLTAAR